MICGILPLDDLSLIIFFALIDDVFISCCVCQFKGKLSEWVIYVHSLHFVVESVYLL